jgi:hypothetical protein
MNGHSLSDEDAAKLESLFSDSFTSGVGQGGSIQVWGTNGKPITLGSSRPSGQLSHAVHRAGAGHHHHGPSGPMAHRPHWAFVRGSRIR